MRLKKCVCIYLYINISYFIRIINVFSSFFTVTFLYPDNIIVCGSKIPYILILLTECSRRKIDISESDYESLAKAPNYPSVHRPYASHRYKYHSRDAKSPNVFLSRYFSSV